MPLKTERPGVFRGTRRSRTAWYVTDPASDPARVEREWRANWAPTNRTAVQWAAKWLLFVLVSVVVIAATIRAHDELIALVPDALDAVIRLLTAVFIVGAVVLGAWLAIRLFPFRAPARTMVPGVLRIPKSVVAWADDETPLAPLWTLSLELGRLEAAATWWARPDDRGDHEFPELPDYRGTPRALWTAAAARAREAATASGFPIPEKLLIPPVSPSDPTG